jgi:Xaa-Pro aminopeptidase
MGVRIEDEIAIGREDFENLSANCPKEVADVEAACMRQLD